MTHIRIISRPPGEAPEAIRDAWIGLILPLPPGRNRRVTFLTSGVLTRPRGLWQTLLRALLGRLQAQSGYVVNAREAVELLAAKDAAAAAWWRVHCDELLDGKRLFLFAADACEECD